MRGIIDYSGEKSFVSFIAHAGNGSIVVAVTESGEVAVKCLQTSAQRRGPVAGSAATRSRSSSRECRSRHLHLCAAVGHDEIANIRRF